MIVPRRPLTRMVSAYVVASGAAVAGMPPVEMACATVLIAVTTLHVRQESSVAKKYDVALTRPAVASAELLAESTTQVNVTSAVPDVGRRNCCCTKPKPYGVSCAL